MNQTEQFIRQTIEESISAKTALLQKCVAEIHEAGLELGRAIRAGGKILFCGNGGSAADAQHLAAELVGHLRRDRRALAAMALTTDTSILTAVGNDYAFKEIFARQVQALGLPGDVFIGISTSGNSENVLAAALAAQKQGITTIGLLGRDGGKIAPAVDHKVIVPSKDTQRIQECHILIGHIWMEMVEQELFGH
ncbi:MAG: D-sedoheptulose 7-phosphate isomerase [candidate division KSB1 bacterium]|nr:D-sedoheptulose 7-phosphate isomerase [candidate division KSB1 bacterium]MDZ7367823.1 D-sedoheptulose 7-phosphate isomerase [candidate division KSB1 bacterium]MDZ7405499.1 D-sedoheptulose 7-phosphate isomerase [candidate division KSB1 bacterium]